MKSIIPPFKPISILSLFFRGLTWTLPNDQNKIYLTFDDGPIPEVTPWVLDVLKAKGIKATFFCVGANVQKHHDIYARILAEGHGVGNHTQNHLSGWTVANEAYLQEIEEAAKYIDSSLFRPPYGRISPIQYAQIKDRYKVIMWDTLSKDYDASLSSEQVYQNATTGVKAGSIIVFHDSLKAECHLRDVLERVIDELLCRNFVFAVI
ncbi:MAG: polysaccharide deacetylase family protein [Saprospiraceae bacterium]|nr:polysaccharide deacetylase family protein [Saprospiraceae bacterium]